MPVSFISPPARTNSGMARRIQLSGPFPTCCAMMMVGMSAMSMYAQAAMPMANAMGTPMAMSSTTSARVPASWYLVVGHDHRLVGIRLVGIRLERRHALGFILAAVAVIYLQIQRVGGQNAKEHAIGIESDAAKHCARQNGLHACQLFENERAKFGGDAH